MSGREVPNLPPQFNMKEKCRPGNHSAPCGPTTISADPYQEYCACGCAASDWCEAQGSPQVNKLTYKRHAERLWALFLISLNRQFDADESVEYQDLKYAIGDYIKRTTHV